MSRDRVYEWAIVVFALAFACAYLAALWAVTEPAR